MFFSSNFGYKLFLNVFLNNFNGNIFGNLFENTFANPFGNLFGNHFGSSFGNLLTHVQHGNTNQNCQHKYNTRVHNCGRLISQKYKKTDRSFAVNVNPSTLCFAGTHSLSNNWCKHRTQDLSDCMIYISCSSYR